ncbi:uncharacterized protein LOC110069302 [Orbicella faveolata]|uniref:uncharacterized protein LOC110069302 n=1 Tax=Orbicella faveolata TaxID=48498 RepID=UPI0009E413A6|nr:uncharacterized protein LOC110069302 [Orbicella faveolata]
MDKVILLLFAVFAVFQVQAAPELYKRLFREEALRDLFYELENLPRERVSNDFFDEPAMSRERLRDELSPRGLCVDHLARCFQYVTQCSWSRNDFHQVSNFNKFHETCCATCSRFIK